MSETSSADLVKVLSSGASLKITTHAADQELHDCCREEREGKGDGGGDGKYWLGSAAELGARAWRRLFFPINSFTATGSFPYLVIGAKEEETALFERERAAHSNISPDFIAPERIRLMKYAFIKSYGPLNKTEG